MVTTVAGQAGLDGTEDGAGTDAKFWTPGGLAVDTDNNLYVVDSGSRIVRKLTSSGTDWLVTTLAGKTGSYGQSVDGIGSAAQFNSPFAMAVDGDGNLYATDVTTVRKVSQTGTVTTLAGAASAGRTDGTGIESRLNSPLSVAMNRHGDLFIADSGNHTVRKATRIATNWVLSTIAGLAGRDGREDGIGSAARFWTPSGVAVDADDAVYVADSNNHAIRKITPVGTDWVVTTLAGQGQCCDPSGWLLGGSVDGTGSAARFRNPTGVAVDGAGNVYVADSVNCSIRKVTPGGVVTTLAGLLGGPVGSQDGTGSGAQFNFPKSVAVDSTGNVYVADTFNNTIRKVTPAGVVTTLAGSAGSRDSYGSADGDGRAARFAYPRGLAVSTAGEIFVADGNNYTIRKMTQTGTNWMVTTVAGVAGTVGSKNGIGDGARFNYPHGIAADNDGNIYVADSGNCTIRQGSPALAITAFGSSFGYKSGQFGFGLIGPAGLSIVVESSSNLLNWQAIWTNALTGGISFNDPQSKTQPYRFYRARAR